MIWSNNFNLNLIFLIQNGDFTNEQALFWAKAVVKEGGVEWYQKGSRANIKVDPETAEQLGLLPDLKIQGISSDPLDGEFLRRFSDKLLFLSVTGNLPDKFMDNPWFHEIIMVCMSINI